MFNHVFEYVQQTYFSSMTEQMLGLTIIGFTLLLAALVFGGNGLYQWFKMNCLTHPELSMGWTVSIAFGCITALIFTILGIVLALIFQFIFLLFIGVIIGCILGWMVWSYLWEAGKIHVAIKYRALLNWFGARQPGFEVGEGDWWIFILAMYGPMDAYHMVQHIVSDVQVKMIVGLVEITAVINVIWEKVAGQLYYFGNLDRSNEELKEPEKSISTELQEVGRAFGSSRESVAALVQTDLGESVKRISYEYLNLRAKGIVTVLKVSKGPEAVPTYDPLGEPVDPWGIRIVSVEVSDFTIPPDVEAAAQEVEEAKRRVEAGLIIRDGMDNWQQPFIKAGADATATMSLAADIHMAPGRPQAIQTVNQMALTKFGAYFVEAARILVGKELPVTTAPPEPTVPTVPPTQAEENGGTNASE